MLQVERKGRELILTSKERGGKREGTECACSLNLRFKKGGSLRVEERSLLLLSNSETESLMNDECFEYWRA